MAEKSDFDLENLRFEHHLKEIEAKKNAELLVNKAEHDHNMEMQRIREAGIRKTYERRNSMQFDNYPPK